MFHAASMTDILYDDDIRSRLDARDAVRWMGEAIDALWGDFPGGLCLSEFKYEGLVCRGWSG